MKPFLFVIWCDDLAANRDFYQSIGFELSEQQHEGHAAHYAAQLSDMVFELHQCADGMAVSNNRLGFVLNTDSENSDTAITQIEALASTTFEMGNNQWYAVVSDPDGRSVELVYSK